MHLFWNFCSHEFKFIPYLTIQRSHFTYPGKYGNSYNFQTLYSVKRKSSSKIETLWNRKNNIYWSVWIPDPWFGRVLCLIIKSSNLWQIKINRLETHKTSHVNIWSNVKDVALRCLLPCQLLLVNLNIYWMILFQETPTS